MSSALVRALELIDEQNQADPSHLHYEGQTYPIALIEGLRAHDWVLRLNANASEPVQIAARGHHLRRWEISRDSYPRTRKGYLAWRNRLYSFHGDAVEEVMWRSGYDEDSIAQTRQLLSKQAIKTDHEAQAYEDAVGLTFLELRLETFIDTVSYDQLTRALGRTWQKMSEAGHTAARSLDLDQRSAEAIQELV